jgi:acetyl-CoA carboxylase carboxyltransferase component
MPGTDQESSGVIRHGSTLVRAFSAATVPTVTLATRKAFGGAFIAMNSKALGAGAYFAWPQAEIGVMGAPQAVSITGRREIAESSDPQATARMLAEDYAARYLGADVAVKAGFVDAVIEPGETRARVARALSKLSG